MYLIFYQLYLFFSVWETSQSFLANFVFCVYCLVILFLNGKKDDWLPMFVLRKKTQFCRQSLTCSNSQKQ